MKRSAARLENRPRSSKAKTAVATMPAWRIVARALRASIASQEMVSLSAADGNQTISVR